MKTGENRSRSPATGKETATFQVDFDLVAFSPDGKTVASAHNPATTIPAPMSLKHC
jgi:hypothetical protein